jgi:hypothetical protein
LTLTGVCQVDEVIEIALSQYEPGAALMRALRIFLERDSYLLRVDANERSITFQIARYLAAEFPEFDVDCEYNRDGVDPKKLRYMDLNPDKEDTFARTVFPDIIVHRRNSENNYLVIEAKKTTNRDSRDIDFDKLAGYKRDLRYRYALFLELAVGEKVGVVRAEWV